MTVFEEKIFRETIKHRVYLIRHFFTIFDLILYVQFNIECAKLITKYIRQWKSLTTNIIVFENKQQI